MTTEHNTSLLGYSTLLQQVKHRVAQAQQRAIYAANEEMLRLYWDLGQMLAGNTIILHNYAITQPAVAQLPAYN